MLSFGLKWVNPKTEIEAGSKPTAPASSSYSLTAPVSLQRDSNPYLEVIHILGVHPFPCLGGQNPCAVQTGRDHLHRREHLCTIPAPLTTRADERTARGWARKLHLCN